jgi:hypothetical protein
MGRFLISSCFQDVNVTVYISTGFQEFRNGGIMNVARKLMDIQKIEITEEDRNAALAKLMNAPVIPMDDALREYKATLDEYCTRFNAQNHHDLMARADELEFEPKVCFEILDKYSFIVRNQT